MNQGDSGEPKKKGGEGNGSSKWGKKHPKEEKKHRRNMGLLGWCAHPESWGGWREGRRGR